MNRLIRRNLDNIVCCRWLRSVNKYDSYHMGCVRGGGGVSYDYASIDSDVLPASIDCDIFPVLRICPVFEI